MMVRTGVVRRLENNLAYIELQPLAGCVGCEKQRQAGRGPGHCGIDLLGLLGSNAQRKANLVPVSLEANNPHGQPSDVTVGERVEVQIPAPNVDWLAMAFRAYGLPTAGLLLGAGLGSMLSEWLSILFAVIGLCAGLWLGRRSVHVPQSLTLFSGPGHPALRIVKIAVQPRS